ncbi:zinc-ribbon domain-containing protein [Propionibacterium acidifaciens]|uniref:zinc ribbon domain-containing protein n=1 Tax=Propionibacterium acidifaciens TaxID=556499 RepID=UPI003C6E2C3E
MMICAKCGHENADGSNFCAQCGERLSTASDTTSVIPAIDEDSAPHAEISAEDSAAVHALPAGHALLVVTRGPDVGARYLLDHAADTDELSRGHQRSPSSLTKKTMRSSPWARRA